jgi:hypothetical protein
VGVVESSQPVRLRRKGTCLPTSRPFLIGVYRVSVGVVRIEPMNEVWATLEIWKVYARSTYWDWLVRCGIKQRLSIVIGFDYFNSRSAIFIFFISHPNRNHAE